jgi:serine/threonine protein kinase
VKALAALIRRSGCLGTDLALDIEEQAAAGLAAIEKQHLVHRDIKPSNIMVSRQDGKLENVKIIDLGLAKGVAEENTLSTVGAFIGTPAYASPEQSDYSSFYGTIGTGGPFLCGGGPACPRRQLRAPLREEAEFLPYLNFRFVWSPPLKAPAVTVSIQATELRGA